MRLSHNSRNRGILPRLSIPGIISRQLQGSHFTAWLILTSVFVGFICSAFADVHESHLISPQRPGELNRITAERSRRQLKRVTRSVEESERSDRAEKQIFRLELLRQIKAIDHMNCFPKVLCGLSVDSDKSFGINKSNFVRSYLELMRNIKLPQDATEERIRTEDEVQEELRWPFSAHNPNRKHHSSFERVSSAGMSASVELPDSLEYLSRGLLESKLGDTSFSMEKDDRMGMPASEGSVEFKEKLLNSQLANSRISSSLSHHATIGSSIPGEKKNKNSGNKSLTEKLSSYFSSWLPESIVSFGKGKTDRDDGSESDMEEDAWARSNANVNGDGKFVGDFLSLLPELWEHWMTTKPRRLRKGKADNFSPDDSTDQKELLVADSTEHDGDIYHTAVSIGKRLKDPKQCDYIYNGCPLEYNKIIEMISSIRTEIHPLDNTADVVSKEFGLVTPPTTTTTTKKPQKKKPRPSTKIMHTLPNGEKVEINFRLAGKEESEESSSSAQVDYAQRTTLSAEDLSSSEKKFLRRKGSPVLDIVTNKHTNRRRIGFLSNRPNIMSERRNEDMEMRSEELNIDTQEQSSQPEVKVQNKQGPKLKLSGLTLSTANKDEPLEISPSYVIIKHQPLSVHTTSVLSPDTMQTQQQPQQQVNVGKVRPQPFQLVQNGQKIDADRITDELKNYIRQSGGLIPKLSLHSSGLITTETGNTFGSRNPFIGLRHPADLTSSISQKFQESFSNPLAGLSLDAPSGGMLQLTSSQLSASPFSSAFPDSGGYSNGYGSSSYASRGPAMVGVVPGRMETIIKPAVPASPTTTTTTSTTTEKIILPGMAETLTLDTEEITDDTMKKLESVDSVPSWITPSPSPASAESFESESEEDDEETILENLNKALLSENNKSKVPYKTTKKKKNNNRVKPNSSRVRPYTSPSVNYKRNKGKKGSGNRSGENERVVIKHAGPYNSSPTVYKSPLTGPGPHGGAYPYLPGSGMRPSVFPGLPFWRHPL